MRKMIRYKYLAFQLNIIELVILIKKQNSYLYYLTFYKNCFWNFVVVLFWITYKNGTTNLSVLRCSKDTDLPLVSFSLSRLSGTQARILNHLIKLGMPQYFNIFVMVYLWASLSFIVNFRLTITVSYIFLYLLCLFIFYLCPFSLDFSILFSIPSSSQTLVANQLF